MSDGLIYLPAMAASYFQTYGFGLVDASTIKQKPYNCFSWGEVRLNKNIDSFQRFDWMDITVLLNNDGVTITEEVAQNVDDGSPVSRIKLDLPQIPLSAADGLAGKTFSQLVEGAAPWLSEALECYKVAITKNWGGRTYLGSEYQLIEDATNLKVRINAVKGQNFNTILPIKQAMERYRSNDAAMNYD